MRVLLSDGSGLTARQCALLLARAGHRVGVLSSTPIGVTRFTRTVSAWHRSPRLGADPHRWLTAALARYAAGRYEALLPTQDQVAVLSWASDRGLLHDVATVVPGWAALVAVFDKPSAHRSLTALGLPRPDTVIVRRLAGLVTWDTFPVYLKLPLSTAASGVIRVANPTELAAAVARLTAWGAFEEGAPGVLVEREVAGPLTIVQGLFDHGRLLAVHACERVAEGVGGAASHKRSVEPAGYRPLLLALGEHLAWHGPLTLDVIEGPAGPSVVDVNPRLVEPMNADAAGVDLPGLMLRLARGETPAPVEDARPGVRTHQALVGLLGSAARGRGAAAREAMRIASSSGPYRDSAEESTPTRGDWRARIPLTVVGGGLLVRPRFAHSLASEAIGHYAITPEGWRTLVGTPGDAANGSVGEG